MSEIRREVVVALPLEQVWEFIADMNGHTTYPATARTR
jgi:hypothetical protein